MEEKNDIEETDIQARFIDMLDHPDDFPEEELKALLDDKTNKENLHVLQLARKAYRRHNTPVPDVDKAWNDFRKQTEKPEGTQIRLVSIISLIAAAVIIAGIFLIHLPQQTITPEILAKAETKAQQTASPKQIRLYSFNGSAQSISNGTVTFMNTSTEGTPDTKEKNDIKTITIPKGKTLKVILSDGTEVWLNAASTITFPVPFDEDKREVRLNGEAYFKVKHEENRPFSITANDMSVTVLGTEFNVRAYPHEPGRVTLVKGLVSLSDAAAKNTVLLHPDQEGTLTAGGKWNIAPADTYATTQWVHGYFYYDEVPLINVIKDLARWYDLGILIKSRTYLDAPIHFSADRNDDVRQAINNLNQLQKATISLENNQIVIR